MIFGWQARITIPAVADQLRAALDRVTFAEDCDAAFRRPGQFGGGAYGPAYQAVVDLRWQLAQMLRQTSENLDLVSVALVLCANACADQDTVAKRKFLLSPAPSATSTSTASRRRYARPPPP
jgi:hypothetical protein